MFSATVNVILLDSNACLNPRLCPRCPRSPRPPRPPCPPCPSCRSLAPSLGARDKCKGLQCFLVPAWEASTLMKGVGFKVYGATVRD